MSIAPFETPTKTILGTDTVVMTPPDVLAALRALVEANGAEYYTLEPVSENPNGLAGRILQHFGADPEVLRLYGAFLEFMDCNIIPDSQFWFMGFTRDMLTEADELDQAGFEYGQVLDRLEQQFADRLHETLEA